MNLSADRARQYFDYDSGSGELRTKERCRSEFSNISSWRRHLAQVGNVVGSANREGYVKVHVDGKYYSAHRVAWLIIHSEWPDYPEYEIDHINGDRSDNRLENLRVVPKSDNQRNSGQRANNTSGVHGVNWKPKYNSKDGDGRWVARIWNGPKHVYLGQFKTLHEASIARKAAERALGYTGTDRPRKERVKA